MGSEFGIFADEIMFGLDQSAAVQNLTRESRTGRSIILFHRHKHSESDRRESRGNPERGFRSLIRSRSKLRLKIRALSSEGRLSGVALSLAPFILFGIITLISPDYFLAVRYHPIIPPAAGIRGAFCCWSETS